MADFKHNNTLEPEKWNKRYNQYLFTMALSKLPENQVEDIVQETFLAALQSAPNFRGDSTERTWLTRILKNKIADYYRKVNTKQGRIWKTAIRESILHPNLIQEFTLDSPNWESPASNLHERDLEIILSEGMKLLTTQESEVLQFKLKGYSTEVISQILKVTKNSCWVSLCRGRKKMKEYVNRRWLNAA